MLLKWGMLPSFCSVPAKLFEFVWTVLLDSLQMVLWLSTIIATGWAAHRMARDRRAWCWLSDPGAVRPRFARFRHASLKEWIL
eukprot:6479202-Amphidinium_carterae.1